MEFRILGPLEIIGNRGPVRLGGIKPRSLLTLLLLNANEPVSAERLALALWGEEASSSAVRNVQVHVSRLRKALGDENVLTTTPVGYRLRVAEGELDADRFQALVEDGRRALAAGTGRAGGGACCARRLSLWRGPALADVAYRAVRAGRDRAAGGAAPRRAGAQGRSRSRPRPPRRARRRSCSALVSAFPARERLAGTADARAVPLRPPGRRARRLRAHARAPVRRARPRARAGAQGAAARDPRAGPVARPRTRPARARRASDEARPAFPRRSVLAAGAEDTFVGRAADLEALTGVYAEVAGGDSPARAAVRRAGHRQDAAGGGVRAARARAGGDRALRALRRGGAARAAAVRRGAAPLRLRVPGAGARRRGCRASAASCDGSCPSSPTAIPDLPEPLAGDPEGARSRLFEAVGSLLCEAAQSTPVVLVLDDLHWADRATLLLLKYLVRYPREARLMVLGTYRDTELDADHPLSATLAELGRERLRAPRARAAGRGGRVRARRRPRRRRRARRAAPDRLRGDRGQRVLRRRGAAPPRGVRRDRVAREPSPTSGGSRCPRASRTSSASASRASGARPTACSRRRRSSGASSSSTCSQRLSGLRRGRARRRARRRRCART